MNKLEHRTEETCSDCIHIEVCKEPNIKGASKCIEFKSKKEYAPVRHGRWIKHYVGKRRYFECSICGSPENKHTAITGRYCWPCGAKMDGGTSDDDVQ